MLLCIAKCHCIISFVVCVLTFAYLFVCPSVSHFHHVSIPWSFSSDHCLSWRSIPSCHTSIIPSGMLPCSHSSFSPLRWIVRDQIAEEKERKVMFSSVVPLRAVRNMNIYKERSTTMNVRWDAVEGTTGYMLLYNALNATKPFVEQEVRWRHTFQPLPSLLSRLI